ncbi:uncharacterized protein FTJAE_12143 [Fusarium tjaetaba]|uniref:Myb-like domain-containing protein n=1 Tax=Fusarium tjaetaba TaxID=1567544 RepID=A0A8H5VBW4_9HYPO|nr:uncharacterized protein FTJAE_12143 [Fusarium tjaetaba]KAF5618782.1 hypothetical protein FTJAE_12143 [Fusarium tjaetaba]
MKPWHEKALKRGRTPLPEGPGQRPWLPLQLSEHRSTTLEVSGASQDHNHVQDAVPTTALVEANESRAPLYRFWEESEVRRLIEMRSGGAKWSAIAQTFPNRTIEALKQTFHKRRHAVEQKIGEERSGEGSAEKNQTKSSA